MRQRDGGSAAGLEERPSQPGDESGPVVDLGEAPGTHNPFQTFRTRTAIPFAILGMIVVYGIFRILISMTPIDPEDPATDEIATMIIFYGVLALWILWACRRSGIGIRRLVGRVPDGYSWLPALGLLVIAGVFSLGSWYASAYGLSVVAPGMLEWLLESGESAATDSIATVVMWTLVAVVMAPVLEEVLFRGVLVNRWGVKWGIRTGIVASAVLFGVLHFIDAAGATIFGLITAVLYLQTRTLIVPIVFHAANNLLAVLAESVYPSDEATIAAQLQEIETMALPGLGIAAVTLPVLVWYLRRHWPGREAGIPYAPPTEIAENP